MILLRPSNASPVWILGIICMYAHAYPLDQSTAVGVKVKETFTQYKEGLIKSEEARSILEKLPREEAISNIVHELQTNPGLSDRRLHFLAYHILSHHTAALTENGYTQFVACLSDHDVAGICAGALTKVAPEKHAEVVAHLISLLGAQDIKSSLQETVLQSLIKMKHVASPALPAIEPIFSDQSNDPILRHWAAVAMLKIGGLAYAMDRFQNLDANIEIGVVGALPIYLYDDDMKWRQLEPIDEAALPKARELVVKLMQSPNLETRKAALETLLPIFGPDHVLIIRSRTDYELNPQLKSALETMSANDPDPVLREKAASVLSPAQIDKMVERTLRYRESSQP